MDWELASALPSILCRQRLLDRLLPALRCLDTLRASQPVATLLVMFQVLPVELQVTNLTSRRAHVHLSVSRAEASCLAKFANHAPRMPLCITNNVFRELIPVLGAQASFASKLFG